MYWVEAVVIRVIHMPQVVEEPAKQYMVVVFAYVIAEHLYIVHVSYINCVLDCSKHSVLTSSQTLLWLDVNTTVFAY